VREPTARQRLEEALTRFARAALERDDGEAFTAYADAQALMEELHAVRVEACRWVEDERVLVAGLPADVEGRSEQAQGSLLERLRRARSAR
jgi:hypothetical protein